MRAQRRRRRRGGGGSPRPSAAGDRVGVVAAWRQSIFLPAAATVSRAKDLAAPGDAVDLVGIAGMESQAHHRGLGLDPMVEALPRAAEILAAVERTVGALRGRAEAGVQEPRVVRRDANVAAIAERRETADLHVLPALAAVGAAEKALAHRDEDRARPGGADRERVAVEHSFAVPGAGGGTGEPDQVFAAILPALPVVEAAHDAVDLEHAIDLGRMAGVFGQAHDPAIERHPDPVGHPRVGEPVPIVAAVLAAVDRDRRSPGVKGLRVLRIDEDRPDLHSAVGKAEPLPMLAAIGAAVGAVLGSDVDSLGIFGVNGNGLNVGLLRQAPSQVPAFAVADGQAKDAAPGSTPPPSHTGIHIWLIGHDELLPSVSECRALLTRSARKSISSGVDSRPRILLRCGKRPNRSMTSMYGRPYRRKERRRSGLR